MNRRFRGVTGRTKTGNRGQRQKAQNYDDNASAIAFPDVTPSYWDTKISDSEFKTFEEFLMTGERDHATLISRSSKTEKDLTATLEILKRIDKPMQVLAEAMQETNPKIERSPDGISLEQSEDNPKLRANNKMANEGEVEEGESSRLGSDQDSGAISPIKDDAEEYVDAHELPPVDSSKSISGIIDDGIIDAVDIPALEPVRTVELLADNERYGAVVDNLNLTPNSTTSTVNNLDDGDGLRKATADADADAATSTDTDKGHNLKKSTADAATSTDAHDADAARVKRRKALFGHLDGLKWQQKHGLGVTLALTLLPLFMVLKTIEIIIKYKWEDTAFLQSQQLAMMRGVDIIKWVPDMRTVVVTVNVAFTSVLTVLSIESIMQKVDDITIPRAIGVLIKVLLFYAALAFAGLSLWTVLKTVVITLVVTRC
ncbi:hypothetical protein ACMFMG_001923 [Clarireedia jacksonii]